jgi:hypothetical protein
MWPLRISPCFNLYWGGFMQLLRVGCLALGLVPLAAPVLAQDTVQLFAPAPKAPPAPSAQTIPVVRAALTEAPPVPLPRPTPEIRSTLTEAPPEPPAEPPMPLPRPQYEPPKIAFADGVSRSSTSPLPPCPAFGR